MASKKGRVRSLKEYSQEGNLMSKPGNFNVLNLPDSLTLNIFNFLSYFDLCRASRVCRKWYRVSHDNSLTRIIDLLEKPMTARKFKSFLRHKGKDNLLELHIRGSAIAGNPSWKTETLTANSLTMLQEKAPKLEVLSVERSYLKKSPVKRDQISFSLLPKTLTHLSFRGSLFQPDIMFREPETNLPNLTCLDLGECVVISSNDLQAFENWEKLKCLYLDGCFRINSGGVGWLTSMLPELTLLDLERTSINDEAVLDILESCTNMKYLYLGHNSITDLPFDTLENHALPKCLELCLVNTSVTSEAFQKAKGKLNSQLKVWLHVDLNNSTRVGCSHCSSHNCYKVINPNFH